MKGPATTTATSTSTSLTTSTLPFTPPPYGHRQGFLPRKPSDYGGGGAFPELPSLQYPLDMGRPSSSASSADSVSLVLHSSSATTTPLQYGADGVMRYDAIVQQGRAPGVRVQSSYSDMVPAAVTEAELARPSAEEEAKVVEETRKALDAVVERKTRASMPTHIAKQSKEATFIRYTPSAASSLHASGASQRLIRLTEAPVDPFQPLMAKHQKLPAAAPEPPVPILHSPPRKLTAEDAAAWKIPPCISNWKNPRGYTIALDKRMATDGRGLQEAVLGDKHARLAESLFVAERVAREEIEERARVRSGVRQREKEEKEEELRRLAEEARRAVKLKEETRDSEAYNPTPSSPSRPSSTSQAERDAIRQQRQGELKRQLLTQNRGKIATVRDEERDISEKIALGQAAPSKQQPFDSRLFGQSEGLGQGFGSEDAYNVYDRPLFQGSVAGTYKPRAMDEDGGGDDAKAGGGGGRSTTGFRGAEGGGGGGRTKPVEFEREDADPFGLGSLLSEAAAEPPPAREGGRDREVGDDTKDSGRRDERPVHDERERRRSPDRDGARRSEREHERSDRDRDRDVERGREDDSHRDSKRRRY